MKAYCDELKGFLKDKVFIAAVMVIALLSYGFATTNIAISIDDLEGDRYVGDGNVMLKAGRFGTFLWSKLQGPWSNSFTTDCLAISLFVFAAINLCILLRRVSSNHISMSACTVFSCLLLSYPLINEVWEYTGTNVLICGGTLLASFSILLIHEILHGKKGKWRNLIGAALLMTWVCSSYESVVSVYIFFVFAVLALQIVYGTEKEKLLKEVLRQGLVYAGVLCAGILLRTLIHSSFLLFTGIHAVSGGATEIYWGTDSALNVIKNWFLGTVRTVMHSIIYFPLTELLFAIIVLVIIGIIAVRKHGAVLLIPGFGMLLSLILLSLVQGSVSPYRTCQVYGAFVAFVVMLLIVIVQQVDWKRIKWMRTAAMVLAAYLCFYQAVYLNYFLTLNYVRSEEEAFVIRQISTDLQTDYDVSKPIVFVGIYKISDYINEKASISQDDPRWKLYSTLWNKGNQLIGNRFDSTYLSRKLPQTNVNSVLCWGWYAHEQEAMQKLFSYYGFTYTPADYVEVFPQANQYAYDTQMPKYPQDGYIQDMGDYIIVCLGEI